MKKILKGFLAIFLAVVMSFGSLSFETLIGVDFGALFEVEAEAVNNVEYCMFPVKTSKDGVSYVNMTRSNFKNGDDDCNAYNYAVPNNKRNRSSSHHHSGYAYDFKGGDRKIYAPFTGTVYIAQDKDCKPTHGVYFVSDGPVMLSTGKIAERVTILFIHDDNINNLTNGMKVKQGEYFYDQGTYQSNNTGKVALHTHLEVAVHKKTESLVNCYSKFDDDNYGIQADDAFYVTQNAKLVDITWKVGYGATAGKTGKMEIRTVPTQKVTSATTTKKSSNVKSKLSFTVKNATNITQNSAKVSASCSYSGTRPSEISVYIGTSKKNMKKYSSDKINHSKNPFDIWYTIKNLEPGTTYYYQFHATVNGTEKTGEIKSFKTKKASSTLTMNVKGASKITKTSARVDATCSYTGTRPSEVSVYIGTSKKNMKKYSSDAINHSKNPFNIWYNLSGLKKNTTYYYQFHAKVNGVDKAYGEIKSFKTAK